MEKNKPGPLVTVDAEKLKWGLRSAFAGMALVVESIQLETGGTAKPYDDPGKILDPLLNPVADTSAAEADAMAERDATIGNIPDLMVPKSAEAPVKAKKGKAEPEPAAVDAVEPDSGGQAATSLSKDDLIVISTQKIKQNTANQKKIGALLKSYGAATLSDLSPDKYEAFMTDLAQI